ncbi:hypothetical protein F4808DRAFT_159413 [Astrocystis sublimbata]|nr:hypothetical protein F4808DRAFT_159413 [Astrocystis sublimbata]
MRVTGNQCLLTWVGVCLSQQWRKLAVLFVQLKLVPEQVVAGSECEEQTGPLAKNGEMVRDAKEGKVGSKAAVAGGLDSLGGMTE